MHFCILNNYMKYRIQWDWRGKVSWEKLTKSITLFRDKKNIAAVIKLNKSK